MAGNKRGRGRAGKAARYRSATSGESTPGYRDNPQTAVSRYLPRNTASNGGSMGDTLKSTNKSRNFSDKAGTLRWNPVRFVDAGVVEPLKDLDEELCAANATIDGTQQDIAEDPTKLFSQVISPPTAPITADSQTPEKDPVFFVDITGDQSLSQPKADLVHASCPDSPKSDTDSGEDVVLFTGRKSQRSDEFSVQVQQVEINMQQVSLEASAEATPHAPSPPSPQPWQFRDHNDDDDIVADYIANMVADDDDDEENDEAKMFDNKASGQSRCQSFIHRNLGGSVDEFDMGRDSDLDYSLSNDETSDSDGPGIDKADDAGLDGATNFDDETLARLLAKQDELGLDDDELVLFSADSYAGARPSGSGISSARQGGRGSKGEGKGRQQAPSASAVADVFNELDLMDWGRHNPPRKPKGKRGQPTFNVSDSELEATLEAVWQKDRLRKKERKQHREELRVQGLLGKNADPTDPRVKYPTHMTFDQIKEEMRTFLLGNEPSIFFPPMDPHARKVIHELANKFNIKSKSAGSGDQRRPALHRTLRTVKYREVYFEEVFVRSGRKYFGRPDVKPRAPRNKGESSGRPGGRGGGHQSAFTYKDGEVVGASAPELGTTNKGRNMLEKMGWSSGMALGAIDNKGILQPVAHVVKRTKAGLG